MAEGAEGYESGYGKRPLWQWVLIYAAIGIAVYGLIYYFVLAKKGGSGYNPAPVTPETSQASPSVTLTTNGFSPADLTVKAGTKVTWTNKSGSEAAIFSSPHPVHTDYQPLNLGSFPEGGILSLTFDKPGTYRYHNHLNPSQTGTIIAQ